MVPKQFSSPNLNWEIIKELRKDHIGNDKELFAIFLNMVTSVLPPKEKNSAKVRGKSSVGKTNMVTAALKHIPVNWYAYCTRITAASIEDDVKDKEMLVILERQLDKYTNEALKQISEDGMEIWKKDSESGKQTHQGFIPRKTVIDTSTSDETDEEVANRSLIIHLEENLDRTKKVIDTYAKKQTMISEDSIKDFHSKKNGIIGLEKTWIKQGLVTYSDPKNMFDFISIPYAPAIPIEVSTSRIARDVKRFWSIVKVLAWLNQKNRPQYTTPNGKKILFATAEDMTWAHFLTNDSFLHSISGIKPQVKEMIETIPKIIKLNKYEVFGGEQWVDRKVLEEMLHVTTNTIKEYVDIAKGKGYVEEYKPHANKVYIKRTNRLHMNHPLFTYEPPMNISIIKPLEEKLIHSQLIAFSYPIHKYNIYNNNTCTPYNIDIPMKKYENIPSDITYDQCLEVLSKKFIGTLKNKEKYDEDLWEI